MRVWNACYEPTVYFTEEWSGTALDMLARTDIPVTDRLWAVMRTELIDIKTIREFAIWCANQVEQTDSRCIAAIASAVVYANRVGEAFQDNPIPLNSTDEERRRSAQASAWMAMEDAPSVSVSSAAKAAAFTLDPMASTAATQAALWAAAGSEERANEQINRAIEIFNA